MDAYCWWMADMKDRLYSCLDIALLWSDSLKEWCKDLSIFSRQILIGIFILFYFIFRGTGTELGVLRFLGKHSTT
jgi:hypothetical protein